MSETPKQPPGRPPIHAKAMTSSERKRRQRERDRTARAEAKAREKAEQEARYEQHHKVRQLIGNRLRREALYWHSNTGYDWLNLGNTAERNGPVRDYVLAIAEALINGNRYLP